VVIVRACQLAAALELMRRLGGGRRPGLPLTSPSRNAERCISAVLAGRALPPGSAEKGRALDQGLRAARGDLVLFLHANNLSPPAVTRPAASTALAAHRENP
jgi:hypothetical protein